MEFGSPVRRSRYVVDEIPTEWGRGTFTGNGLLGTLCRRDEVAASGDGCAPVLWEIGRTDVMDRSRSEAEGNGRFKNNDCPHYRVPIGQLVLLPLGTVTRSGIELDLLNAEESGFLDTAAGTLRWRSITHAVHEAIIIDLTASDDLNPAVGFRPGYSGPLSFEFGVKVDNGTLNPPPTLFDHDGVHYCLQRTWMSGTYVTAYTVLHLTPGTKRVVLTVQRAASRDEAVAAARNVLASVVAASPKDLDRSHREWWHRYWSLGGVEIPDARLEQFFYLQLYKFACATRADRPAYDLLGPWTFRTVWAAMWWNLNVQLTYLPLYAANRLELAESLPRLLDAGVDNLLVNGRPLGPGAMLLGRASDRDLLGTWDREWCNLPWICHNYYTHYRHAMDPQMVPGLVRLLVGAARAYLTLIREEPDGLFHLPVGVSPEYPQEAEDTHINLALFRWVCSTLLDLAPHHADAPRWQEVLARLAPYPVNQTGLMIGRDVPYAVSHRHFSHLMAIWPLRLLDPDDSTTRPLLERSVRQWTGYDAEHVGYSRTVAASLFALLGDGDAALTSLNTYLDSNLAQPNSMYLELGGWGGPTSETPASVLGAIQDLLLSCRGNVIRVFPAMPQAWLDASLRSMRTDGAFLVDADRRGGDTVLIRVTAEVGGQVSVESPWPETELRHDGDPLDSDSTVQRVAGRIIKLDLHAGASITLTQAAVPRSTTSP